MKIIPASYEIMPDTLSIEKRVELSGRISYKSEDKITDDSAGPFIRRVVERGHWPVMDMAAVHVVFEVKHIDNVRLWIDYEPGSSRYLQSSFFSYDGDDYCLMSGSVRAWTEYLNRHKRYVDDLKQELHNFSPVCFPSFDMEGKAIDADIYSIFDNVSAFCTDADIIKKHHYVGVKFTVSRAVTHELVRHRPVGIIQESTRYCRYGDEVSVIAPLPLADEVGDYRVWWKSCLEAETDYHCLLKENSPQVARLVLPQSTKADIMLYCTLAQWEHILRLRTAKAADPAMREVMVPLAAEMKAKWHMLDLGKKPYEE